MKIGVDTLPPLPKDAGDRNRTSPFAFTGNRFEFRAPGSKQSIAGPLVAMNTIMAESLDYMRHRAGEGRRRTAPTSTPRCRTLLTEIITEHGAIIFNGDGYSDDLADEAAERGLPNLQDHGRRAARADHRDGDGAVREVQGASTSASCTAATRSTSSSTC